MSAKSRRKEAAPAGKFAEARVAPNSISSETVSRGRTTSDVYELTVPPGEVPGEAEMREILDSDVQDLIVPFEYAEPEAHEKVEEALLGTAEQKARENLEAALRSASDGAEPLVASGQTPRESYENIEAAARAAAENAPGNRSNPGT